MATSKSTSGGALVGVGVILLVVGIVIVIVTIVIPKLKQTPYRPPWPDTYYAVSTSTNLGPADKVFCPQTKGPAGTCQLLQKQAIAQCNYDPACKGLFRLPQPAGTPYVASKDYYQLTREAPKVVPSTDPMYGSTYYEKKAAPANWAYVGSTSSVLAPADEPNTFTCFQSQAQPNNWCVLPGTQAVQTCNEDPLCTGLWDFPQPNPAKYAPGLYQLSHLPPKTVSADSPWANGKFFAKTPRVK